MKLEVYAAHTHADERDMRGKTAVVIDTLRATSTIITALHNGCQQVLPVAEVEEAMAMRANMSESTAVLGGERDAVKLAGFDYGNSPLEYTPENILGKTLILTTTNGTLAIYKAAEANEVLIGALINGRSVADKLAADQNDTVLLCAGTKCKFSLEDILTAGHILYLLEKQGIATELDDLGNIALDMYTVHKDNITGTLHGTTHYDILVNHGMEKDVEYCLKRDIVDILPKFSDGLITA